MRAACVTAVELRTPQVVAAVGEAGAGKSEACKLALEFACAAFCDGDFEGEIRARAGVHPSPGGG